MISPPILSNEKERLAQLASYDIMDSPPEIDYDSITKIASEICDMPVALITFMGEERQWFKSKLGVDLTENQRALTFCGHGMEEPLKPLVVTDATKDPRFSGNPLVTGDYHVRFYAGVQLVNQKGYPLGTLCVFDMKSNDLTSSQLEALQVLANQVVRLLDLRKTVMELKGTQGELLQTIDHLKEFDYMVSHDIKGPLRNMLLMAEAIETDYGSKLDDNGMQYLKLLSDSANDAISYVDGVLNYSKAMYNLESNPETIDLNELLRTIVDQANAPSNISVELASNFPTVKSSKVAFQQIFTNLLSNAIKYNDKENGTIDISYSDDEKWHYFRLADNGRGIPKDKLNKVFSRFYMVDKKDSQRKGSTGIGLSIVQKRASELNGQIKVESELEKGTTFSFVFPK